MLSRGAEEGAARTPGGKPTDGERTPRSDRAERPARDENLSGRSGVRKTAGAAAAGAGVRRAASDAVDRGASPAGSTKRRKPAARRTTSPAPEGGARKEATPEGELTGAVGTARAERLSSRLKDAARAFNREQFVDARRILRPIVREAPTASAARELLGLTYYRLGEWKQAARELEAFAEQTGSAEQHPVLADCYRAMGRHDRVDELWLELREASPDAALVAEGRIVVAGSLADRGRLSDGIGVLERVRRPARNPQEHHLRVAYALGDLYERAGDLAKARTLFAWVIDQDPGFADAGARLRLLD